MPVLETVAAVASLVGAGASSVSAMKDAGDAMHHTRTVSRVRTPHQSPCTYLNPLKHLTYTYSSLTSFSKSCASTNFAISAATLRSRKRNGAKHTATRLQVWARTGVSGRPARMVGVRMRRIAARGLLKTFSPPVAQDSFFSLRRRGGVRREIGKLSDKTNFPATLTTSNRAGRHLLQLPSITTHS
jgi:hypothetical protein